MIQFHLTCNITKFSFSIFISKYYTVFISWSPVVWLPLKYMEVIIFYTAMIVKHNHQVTSYHPIPTFHLLSRHAIAPWSSYWNQQISMNQLVYFLAPSPSLWITSKFCLIYGHLLPQQYPFLDPGKISLHPESSMVHWYMVNKGY